MEGDLISMDIDRKSRCLPLLVVQRELIAISRRDKQSNITSCNTTML